MTILKQTIAIFTTAMLALGIASVSLAADNAVRFSNRSLRGTYSVTFEGTNSGGGGATTGDSLAPVNGVGVLTATGDGHFTGTQTANILLNTNGVPTSSSSCPTGFPACTAICTTQLVGTYIINSDGTGTTTATATPVAGSDTRCGAAGGFTTTSTIVLQTPKHLLFVGTDPDSTVRGEATLNARR
jgi:hypothetical protein